MVLTLSRFNQWRHAWAMAWLQRSVAPEHQHLKGDIQRAVWRMAEWVLPAFQLLTSVGFVIAVFHWLQGTGIREADVVFATIASCVAPVTFWGVFYLVTDHRDSSQGQLMNKQQALLGAWLASPFMLFNDVPKNGLARRLVLLQHDPGQVRYLFPWEARGLQALLTGLTHASVRQDALDVALPKATQDTTSRARF
jgi:hypothetical protein